MNQEETLPVDANEEIPALIETMLAAEQRLEELTGGEVDTVAGRDGRTFLLRRAQEQLRHNEIARQTGILNALPAHIALLDADGVILSVNEAWRQFAGRNVLHAPGHGVGLNYLSICDEARGDNSSEAQQVAGGIRSVLGGAEKNFTIEYPCHSPLEQRWFQLTVTPLANDRPHGVVVMHLNITERRLGEVELRKVSSIVQNSPDFIGITSLGGQVLFVNSAGQKMVGLEGDEQVKKTTLVDYVDETDRERIQNQILPTLFKNGHWEGETVFRNFKKRTAIPMWQHAFFIVEPGTENRIGLATICRDLSDRKNLEAQFRQSQKMEAIGQLAGGVAHDFNNLLLVIQCYTRFVLDSKNLTEKERGELSEVFTASEMAASLTRQLLTFSRKQLIQFKSVDINQTIDGLGKMLRRVIGEDILLRMECSPGLPFVVADAGLIEQVVMNLSVNARDAMPHGGKLTVETALVQFDSPCVENVERKPGAFIRLRVQDNGGGMTPEIMQRIFEPFFTTKGIGRGTGLGLATVYGIAQQHQGWIEVSSQLGEGTTFDVYFPVTTAPPSPGKPAHETKSVRGTETILVVEDDASVRGLIRLILQRHGYIVVEAISGDAALELWKSISTKIDLVITDMVMPGEINGLELGQKLIAQRPGLKVIYTSGYIDFHERAGGYILEQNINFVQKPYQPMEILRVIRRVLEETAP